MSLLLSYPIWKRVVVTIYGHKVEEQSYYYHIWSCNGGEKLVAIYGHTIEEKSYYDHIWSWSRRQSLLNEDLIVLFTVGFYRSILLVPATSHILQTMQLAFIDNFWHSLVFHVQLNCNYYIISLIIWIIFTLCGFYTCYTIVSIIIYYSTLHSI